MTRLRPIALSLALFLGLATSIARAQEPPAEGEGGESPGSGPVPGYVASGLLGGLAIFILCKSARR